MVYFFLSMIISLFNCFVLLWFQVQFSVFKAYAEAVGYLYVLFAFFNIMIFQGLNVFSNYWLTFWTEDPLLKNTTLGHTDEYEKRFQWYLIWYTVIGVVQGKYNVYPK